MSSRVRLELIPAKDGEREIMGPYKSKVLFDFLVEKYSSETGEIKFSNSDAAADFCHDLVELCMTITLPSESDDIGVHDSMFNLAAIASLYVNLQRIKSNNKRLIGYSLRWG